MNLTYEERLEKTVEKLLPYYYKYHELTNTPVPEIDFLVKQQVVKQVPRLLQGKNYPQSK
jgi:hypothetical protein